MSGRIERAPINGKLNGPYWRHVGYTWAKRSSESKTLTKFPLIEIMPHGWMLKYQGGRT